MQFSSARGKIKYKQQMEWASSGGRFSEHSKSNRRRREKRSTESVKSEWLKLAARGLTFSEFSISFGRSCYRKNPNNLFAPSARKDKRRDFSLYQGCATSPLTSLIKLLQPLLLLRWAPTNYWVKHITVPRYPHSTFLAPSIKCWAQFSWLFVAIPKNRNKNKSFNFLIITKFENDSNKYGLGDLLLSLLPFIAVLINLISEHLDSARCGTVYAATV